MARRGWLRLGSMVRERRKGERGGFKVRFGRLLGLEGHLHLAKVAV